MQKFSFLQFAQFSLFRLFRLTFFNLDLVIMILHHIARAYWYACYVQVSSLLKNESFFSQYSLLTSPSSRRHQKNFGFLGFSRGSKQNIWKKRVKMTMKVASLQSLLFINSFPANGPSLSPLKTLENLWLYDISRNI